MRQRKNLIPAGVGKHRAIPVHEAMDAAEAFEDLAVRDEEAGGRCLPMSMRAPVALRLSTVCALTVAWVPTGMKIGVSTSP